MMSYVHRLQHNGQESQLQKGKEGTKKKCMDMENQTEWVEF